MTNTKKIRGSVLVFSLIILSMLLISGIAVITAAALEKTSGLSTGKSVLAFQAADSGAERVLQRLYRNDSPPLGDPSPVNYALASTGATVSVSSQYQGALFKEFANNGEESGMKNALGQYQYWNNQFAQTDTQHGQYLEVNFPTPTKINTVVVYFLGDSYPNPTVPTDTTTFTRYGLVGFTLTGKKGGNTTTLKTITGNNLTKRTVTFPGDTYDSVRITDDQRVTGDPWTRIVELEAYDTGIPLFSDIGGSGNPGGDSTLTALASRLTATSSPSCNTTQNAILGTNNQSPGYTFRITFYDVNNVLISCSDTAWRDKVVKIKSEGFFRNTSRVIEIGIHPRT